MKEALDALNNLYDLLEEDGWDVDYDGGKLIVRLNNHTPPKELLLTYHGVMKQIWLASTQTGAHHFDYSNGEWVCTRTNRPLSVIINEELSSCEKKAT